MDLRTVSDLEDFAAAAEGVNPQLAGVFEETVPSALRGSSKAALVYVTTMRQFTEDVVLVLDPSRTDFDESRTNAILVRSLRSPLSGWAAHFGFGKGVAAFVVATAREISPRLQSIAPPSGFPDALDSIDVLTFDRHVETALQLQDDPLIVIERGLGLDRTSLGALFGVSRQAVDQWTESGIPAGRMEQVAAVLRVVEILNGKLKPGRLPLVARRSTAGLQGNTLIRALTERPIETAALAESVFDWSGTA